MLRNAVAVVLFFVLTACTITNRISGDSVSYADSDTPTLYQAFKNALVNEDAKKVRGFYSVSFYGEDDVEGFDDMDSIRFLRSWVVTEKDHFETRTFTDGCLVVNGFDSDGSPDTLTLSYIRENDRWVIIDVFVDTHEDVSEFYIEAKCPSFNE